MLFGDLIYDYWFSHKKLICDEIFTIFHLSTNISLNIGPRTLNPHIMDFPFPLAAHYTIPGLQRGFHIPSAQSH